MPQFFCSLNISFQLASSAGSPIKCPNPQQAHDWVALIFLYLYIIQPLNKDSLEMSTKNSDSFIWCCNKTKEKISLLFLIVEHLQIHRYLIQLWQRNYDLTSLPFMTACLVKSRQHSFFIYCSGPSCSKGGNTIHWDLGLNRSIMCWNPVVL